MAAPQQMFGVPMMPQQNQQQPLLGAQQPIGGLFGQQQGGLFGGIGGGGLNQPQQPNQNQMNFQNQAQQIALPPGIKNLSDIIEDLNRKKKNSSGIIDRMSNLQQGQQTQPNLQALQREVLERLQTKTQELYSNTRTLAEQQQDLTMKLEEYVRTLGFLDKLSTDGQKSLDEVQKTYKEYQQADQILQSTYQRLEYSSRERKFMYDQGSFQVPQEYQRSVVTKLNEEIQRVGTAIVKLEDFIEYNTFMQEFDNTNFDEMVDAHLENKLQRLSNLGNLLFLLQQKIRYMQNKVDTLRSKKFEKLYPEKNKKMEFKTTDWAQDRLQEIIQSGQK